MNRPTPTMLKIIRGNPGCRPINKAEPRPVGDLKEPPAWMDPLMQEAWNYAIENAPPGLLKRLDAGALATWVAAHVTFQIAVMEVRKGGLLTRASKKEGAGIIQNPFLAIQNKQAIIMLRAASEMGFTPSSRSRIMLGELMPTEGSVWDDIESATG